MQDTNIVVVVGRLTKDIEVSYLQSGTAVGKFSLAVNRSVKRNDTWEDETSFFNVTLFGKSAENLKQYLIKGKQVTVQGTLRQDRWEKDGQKFSNVSIIADNIQLCGGSKTEGNVNNSSANRIAPQTTTETEEGFSEDIPF